MKFEDFSESTREVVKVAANSIDANGGLLFILTNTTAGLVFGTSGVSIIFGIMVLLGMITGMSRSRQKQTGNKSQVQAMIRRFSLKIDRRTSLTGQDRQDDKNSGFFNFLV